MITLGVVIGYLLLLLILGVVSSRTFRGTSSDYFVASRSIGPFMLLMSVFGTTMTGFALVGSTGKSFQLGIGVYGLMASWSGLVHSAVFFLVGIRLWAIGKRHGYLTQCQYFRARFQSPLLGYLLFAVLVTLVIPYLLVGILSAAKLVQPVTAGLFPETFPHAQAHLAGGVPPWLTGAVICAVVLGYVFIGGVRSAVWANTFQTLVFMLTGIVAFWLISRAMGGAREAGRMVLEYAPAHAVREKIPAGMFASYLFIPLSVGMFPHVFQHWLTARSAKSFRLTVVAHPLCIAIVWVPCILVGIWAAALVGKGDLTITNPNATLGTMVGALIDNPWLTGLLTAGILAAIMSSLDSQFVCLGTLFTNDIVVPLAGEDRFDDRQRMWLGRGFVALVVCLSYALAMALIHTNIFDLGVWCFTGFSGLFPIVLAATWWKRATKQGAIAAVASATLVWGWFFRQDILLDAGPPGPYLVAGVVPAVWVFLAAAVAMVLGSLASRPPDPKVVARFFP